jgi:hypothetical protein
MKKITFIITVTFSLLLSSSCKKQILDVKSTSQLTLDNYFASYKDCRAATAPLYAQVWYAFSSQFYFTLGDGRGNNMFTPYGAATSFIRFSETAETADLNNAWASLYLVVTQSDYVVNNIGAAAQHGVSQANINACTAEARFMRGLAYWYLGSCFGNVPIVEDPAVAAKNFLTPPNTFEDVLQYAIRDLEYAAQWLPVTDDKGRITKSSALGVLSRLYITAACYARGGKFSGKWTKSADDYYTLAKNAAKQVCSDGNYSLMTDYEQLFRVQNNNNSESLFALQFVPGSAVYGTGNRNQDWLAFGTAVTDGLTAYGGYLYASGELVQLMYTRGEIKRQKATYFYPGAVYNYLTGSSQSPAYLNSAGNLAIPANFGTPTFKKHVVGNIKDSGGVAMNGNSGLAAPMMRLAEVYLLYAEAILGTNSTTSDPEALKYFNMVRTRAGLAPVMQISLQDIWEERRCELAMEGQFWYDMVRRGYWDQAWVLNYMNNQHRAQFYNYLNGSVPNGFAFQVKADGSPNTDGYPLNPATADKLLLPYPATELVLNPQLRSTPVPFNFNN